MYCCRWTKRQKGKKVEKRKSIAAAAAAAIAVALVLCTMH
jgi:hypothetical protein